jgi:aspartyl-tRNA(Asn)/glutamyl-tRNA(Gln) amidotransferase subunit C
MTYNKEYVLELAKIARIAITEDEAEALVGELESLHGFAEILQNQPDRADPFWGAVSLSQLRDDEVGECLSQADALANAPVAENGAFVVPRVIER